MKDFLVDHPSILECPISPTPHQDLVNSWDDFGHITLDKPATTDFKLPYNTSVCNDSIDFNIMPDSQDIMSTSGNDDFPSTPLLEPGTSILIVDLINTSPDVSECIEETSLAVDSLSDTSANTTILEVQSINSSLSLDSNNEDTFKSMMSLTNDNENNNLNNNPFTTPIINNNENNNLNNNPFTTPIINNNENNNLNINPFTTPTPTPTGDSFIAHMNNISHDCSTPIQAMIRNISNNNYLLSDLHNYISSEISPKLC